jgi:hypothetical protein
MSRMENSERHLPRPAPGGEACTYLGRCDDATNYYAFPTAGNCCHTEKRPFAVEPLYQSNTCLGKGWKDCPRYQAAVAKHVNAGSRATSSSETLAEPRLPRRAIVSAVATLAIVVAALLLILRPTIFPRGQGVATSTRASMQSTETSAAGPTAARTAATVGLALASAQSSPVPTLISTATWTPGVTLSPIPSPTAAATRRPRATPTETPTRTPSLTSTRTPTATPSRTQTRTPTSTSTQIPTRTPTPTRITGSAPPPTTPPPTLTRQPAATSTPFPAPVLLAPSDGQVFSDRDEIVLSWQPVGQLPADVYYVITVAYSHLGATWYDETPWTRNANWMLSEHRYLLDLADDGQFHWSVQVMRQTGIDANGRPTGVAVGPMSVVWMLYWRSGGGETRPTPLPP